MKVCLSYMLYKSDKYSTYTCGSCVGFQKLGYCDLYFSNCSYFFQHVVPFFLLHTGKELRLAFILNLRFFKIFVLWTLEFTWIICWEVNLRRLSCLGNISYVTFICEDAKWAHVPLVYFYAGVSVWASD